MRFKDKKNKRQRGSKTHGWGAMKKHRGAGNRGGRGNAGSGKRGDAKKTLFQVKKVRSGKYGFHNPVSRKIRAVNISDLDRMAISGKLKKEKDIYPVNLKAMGYDKLLGAGKPANRFRITAVSASQKAVSKIQEAGGEVILSGSEE
jgi:large subunit ribosomal protein L15